MEIAQLGSALLGRLPVLIRISAAALYYILQRQDLLEFYTGDAPGLIDPFIPNSKIEVEKNLVIKYKTSKNFFLLRLIIVCRMIVDHKNALTEDLITGRNINVTLQQFSSQATLDHFIIKKVPNTKLLNFFLLR